MQDIIERSSLASLEQQASAHIPSLVINSGERITWRFIDFFAASIRNRNTREAYYRAVTEFLAWCEAGGLVRLEAIRPIHVASYIEHLNKAIASRKLHLAGIRRCFDWLVSGGALEANPAVSVKGPAYVVRKGKTPILDAVQMRELLDSPGLSNLVGLRDRALLATMVFTFGRVGAVVGMDVEDYFLDGRRPTFRLHEKGGKLHTVPAHHNAIEYMGDYLDASRLEASPKAPLFQTMDRRGRLSGNRMSRYDVFKMIKRRVRRAGLPLTTRCHTMRATGITNYLENGGSLEHARALAAHESSQTTRLYDHSGDRISLDEIERIRI